MMRVPLARLLSVSFGLCGLIAAQSTITTTFASDNGGAAGGAVHFDLQVTNPLGVAIVTPLGATEFTSAVARSSQVPGAGPTWLPTCVPPALVV